MRKTLSVLAAAATMTLAGCETMPGASASTAVAVPALLSGYTCCNLHYENDWISVTSVN